MRVFQPLIWVDGAWEGFPALGSSCPPGCGVGPWMIVHHLLPPSLAPRVPWEGNIQAWSGDGWGKGCREPGRAAALLRVSPVSESSYSVIPICGAKQAWGICHQPPETRKVISPVTATNWNHDVSGEGDDSIINKWQGGICRVDKHD